MTTRSSLIAPGSRPDHPTRGSCASRERILLVDDEELVLRSLGRILRAFDVVTATDAADTIAKTSADLRAVILAPAPTDAPC